MEFDIGSQRFGPKPQLCLSEPVDGGTLGSIQL
jgi:hypothetical protein